MLAAPLDTLVVVEASHRSEVELEEVSGMSVVASHN
jgi:hypothetical protein